MWYKWFFDGIGSSVFSLVVGAIIGSFTGYKNKIETEIRKFFRTKSNGSTR